MSFDIHNALSSVKIYGILTGLVFVLCVLQPQKFMSLLVAGEEAWAGWTAHIGGDLWVNLLAVLVAIAAAWFLDLFGLRRPSGAGTRDLGGPRG